jgi:hypothetical protein
MPALAGVPGTDSAKAVPKSRLHDSGDHIQILSVQRIDAEDKVAVMLRVDNGYHINANPASEPFPTTLAVNGSYEGSGLMRFPSGRTTARFHRVRSRSCKALIALQNGERLTEPALETRLALPGGGP